MAFGTDAKLMWSLQECIILAGGLTDRDAHDFERAAAEGGGLRAFVLGDDGFDGVLEFMQVQE